MYVLGCLLTLLIAILNVRELIIVYFYLISVSMLYFSYQRNVQFVNYIIATEAEIRTHDEESDNAFYSMGAALIRTVLMQCVIGFLYQYLNPTVLKHRGLSKTVLISFLSPAVLCFLPFPDWILENIPFYTILLPIAISKYIFWSNIPVMTHYIAQGWRFCRNFIM